MTSFAISNIHQSSSITLHLSSSLFYLCSSVFYLCSLVFHLCSLVFTCVHLCSTCVHLCSLVFTCVHLRSTWVHLCSSVFHLCGVLDQIQLQSDKLSKALQIIESYPHKLKMFFLFVKSILPDRDRKPCYCYTAKVLMEKFQ